MKIPLKTPFALAALCAAALLAGCGDGDDPAAPPTTTPFTPATITSASCTGAATLTLPASKLALPTNGVRVTSATLVAATDAGNVNGDFCKILAEIDPVDTTAPVIHAEINLPVNWNGELVHEGGGGFDGVLITGLDPLDFAPTATATPLARHFMTFGDDAGHVSGITTGTFAANDEALANYGRQSLKKTHDTAIALMQALYQVNAPLKAYFVGSSTGGRDALSAIQNWPADYDAIFINRPALNYTGLRLSNVQLGRSIFLNGGAGWLDPAKTLLLMNTVTSTCDALDGLQDGIVSNVAACKAQQPAIVAALRCPGGADTGDTCLSDAQLATVETMSSPLMLNYQLAHGVTQYAGYNLLSGTVFGPPYSSSRNFGPNNVGPQAPTYKAVSTGSTPNSPNAYVTGDQWMKYFITRNSSFDTLTVDPANPGMWQQRISDVSALTDAADPNIDAFLAKGGRIVWTHGQSDEVVSTNSSVDYYQALVARYGRAKVDAAVRFYLIPGNGHGDTGPFVPTFDSLGILTNWYENGVDPADTIVAGNSQTKAATDTSPGGTAQRPLCRYPTWPKYVGGNADANVAASFSCVAS